MSQGKRSSDRPRREAKQAESAAFHTEQWDAGSTVFGPGNGHDRVYLVRTGCIRLFKSFPDGRQISVGLLGSNTVFTQEDPGTEWSSGISAVAMVDSTVSTIPIEELAVVISGSPELAPAMISGLNRRITEVQTLIASLSTASVQDRLADMLLLLASRFGSPTSNGMIDIDLPVSHQALANMIGAHRVTISRHLGSLDDEGLVKALARNRISVDVEGLRKRIRSHHGMTRKSLD